MKYQLIVKTEAELDMLESSVWYEEQKLNLGRQFFDAIDSKFKLIQQNPLHYQVRYKNTRLALVDRFPFAIHFTIEDDRIYVLAILSTYRNSELR